MEGILGAAFSGKGYIIISRVERTKGRCCNGTNIKKDSFNSLLIVFLLLTMLLVVISIQISI